jgi:Nuclease-related domain
MASERSKQPGEWALARAQREWRISTALVAATVLTVPASILALLLDRPLVVLVPMVALALVAALLAERRGDLAVRWTKGGRSEQAVGELLDVLGEEGYVVAHDLEQSFEGNIDHVVAGPNGAFLIETKHRRYEDRALAKAKRQAARLHGELGVWVTPVICVQARQRPPFRHQGVWVMSADHLTGWIRDQRGRPVGSAALQRLAARR